MELKFTLFIKFALSAIVIISSFVFLLGKIKFSPKFNFNLAANLFYNFKHDRGFLFPNPSRGFVNETHCCV